MATVIWILDNTFARVGNEKYSNNNRSYGITTLREKHLELLDGNVEFDFKAKSGKNQQIKIFDKKIVDVIKRINELPGYEVFKYIDGSSKKYVYSEDVNEYIQSILGSEYSSKDFRTWGGTYLTSIFLRSLGVSKNEDDAENKVRQVIKDVAFQLGNTPNVCRSYYIHPTILESYKEGELVEKLDKYETDKQFYKDNEYATYRLLKRS